MRTGPILTVQLGLLAGLTAAMQLGPLYIPGAGSFMAMAATLPVAIAAALRPRRCTWFFVAAALVIGLISLEEMFVFVTTTGPLGLMLGMFLDRPAWAAVLSAGSVLAGGMVLLPVLAGVYPFGGVEVGWSAGAMAVGYLLFALAYAGLWHGFFVRVWGRVRPAVRYTRVDELS